jgi:hypothetical protein
MNAFRQHWPQHSLKILSAVQNNGLHNRINLALNYCPEKVCNKSENILLRPLDEEIFSFSQTRK